MLLPLPRCYCHYHCAICHFHPTQSLALTTRTAGRGALQQVLLKFRFDRAPVIGDKFATRAGQKGVMSQLWPSENIPFSEGGMQPDIMFNPHGFPSRMTIGMILEIMGGKAGALHGVHQDSTPFQFREDQPATEFFGEQLSQVDCCLTVCRCV